MIPVIDLGADSSLGQQHVLDAVRDAFTRVGFAYLVGHEVPEKEIDGVFRAARGFHALPGHTKMEIELDARHRGYIPIGTSTDRGSRLADVTRPNQSASFMMMREAGPDDPDVRDGAYLAGPNQWPALGGFREAVEGYHDTMAALGRRMMGLFAAVLGDHDDVLETSVVRPTTWLRLIRYPAGPPDRPDGLYGSAPHIDFGALTILAQDHVGGLQVRTVTRHWVDVPPRSRAFVINTGEMMRRWSNGTLLATPHRVINTSARERFSVAFFFDPSVATIVEPLASCVAATGERRYPPVEFATFLRAQLETAYDRHRGVESG